MAKLNALTGNPTPQAPFSAKTPVWFVLNRGRNTGGGQTYVYWHSPNAPDPTGIYYPAPNPGGVPFGQLTDITWAATSRT